MKKQINKILFSFSLLVIPIASTPAQPMPQQMPANAQMPSVADVFGGMSEEEITKQVQEAQKLFENLSPEEMAEFEKIIEQTIQTMSPQDLEDIAGIAKMVEPHLDIPKEEPKAESKSTEAAKDSEKANTKESSKKTESSDTANIQQLIDNISQQIDEVLQKINSEKSLFEEVFNKWSSKTTFDNLKRQILALKQSRLAKKLTAKENAEDKELVKKLELFYLELAKLNAVFEVEDSFGLSPSKSKLNDLIKQTKSILALFDDTIDELMPILEKFLRKYDPEALQMAKEAEERKKQAEAHAKDASVKRGSTAAQSVPNQGGLGISQQPVSGSSSMSYPGDFGSMPSMYDQHHMPHSSYGYPGFNDTGFPGGNNPATEKKDDDKKTEKNDPKLIDENKIKSDNAYDDVIEAFDDHFAQYNDKKVNEFNNFLQQDLSSYPDAVADVQSTLPKGTQAPETLAANDVQAWLASSGNFTDKGFQQYISQTNKTLASITKELKDAHKVLADVSDTLSDISEEQLKKLENHKFFTAIRNRINSYSNTAANAMQNINQRYIENKKAIKDPDFSPVYAQRHQNLITTLDTNLNAHFSTINEEIDNLQDKIKRTIKRKSNKKKSKASRAINSNV